jgi:hypothetical protein
MEYLIVGMVVLWGILFVYLGSIAHRQRLLERDLKAWQQLTREGYLDHPDD